MLGAIIGDIVGSFYEVEEINAIKSNPSKKRSYEERIKILNKDIPLFTKECSYTDDSVLTLAIANALIEPTTFEESLRFFGNEEESLGVDKYGRSRFGKGFVSWLKGDKIGDSYGNGASMRISPVAYYYDDLDFILEKTKEATIPSHNNEEAIKGAQAVSSAIYLAQNNYSKDEIKKFIEEKFGYFLNFNLEDLQHNYRFSSRTNNSVPEAIFCFLESNDFEDCLRKSISIGGDTDTIAAIACSIAESFYGIPLKIQEQALDYLPENYKTIVNKFYSLIKLKKSLMELEICHDSFWEYTRIRTKRPNYPVDIGVWGIYFVKDKDTNKTDYRVLVPQINDELSEKINVHEYAHAYELFCLLEDEKDLESIDSKKSELFATQKEQEYQLKKIL